MPDEVNMAVDLNKSVIYVDTTYLDVVPVRAKEEHTNEGKTLHKRDFFRTKCDLIKLN